jgi:hypothetical protein
VVGGVVVVSAVVSATVVSCGTGVVVGVVLIVVATAVVSAIVVVAVAQEESALHPKSQQYCVAKASFKVFVKFVQAPGFK